MITPTVGTLLLIGEDAIDRFLTDPYVRRNPNSLGRRLVRSGLNPNRALANLLRGHLPS